MKKFWNSQLGRNILFVIILFAAAMLMGKCDSDNAVRIHSSEDMIAWLALDGQKVVGFIGLQKAPVGTCMILDVIQVSAAYRGQGIGRKLFEIGRREARKAGAEALYISACPAEETIAFYFAMGAKPAESPIREIAEAEPDDLQLICPLLPDRE